MSAYLSKMVGKAEKEVSQFIADMEDKLLYPSADVRLLDEVNRAAKQKITELGLDSQDTTGEELYHALQAKFHNDSAQIDRAIGIDDSLDVGGRIQKAVQFVQHVHGQDETWALKNVAAKKLLRSLPPKKTAARLGYRSLESMLKREDASKVLLCAKYIESTSWQRSLSLYVSHLSAADYEQRPVHFLILNNIDDDGPNDYVSISDLGGSLALWPDKSLQKTSGLHLVLLLLRGLNQLGVRAAPKTITQSHPLLNWWADASHVISLHDSQPVSFNLHDVAANHLRNLDYSAASTQHGGNSLWSELEDRYAKLGAEILPDIEAQILSKAKKLTVPTADQLAADMVSI